MLAWAVWAYKLGFADVCSCQSGLLRQVLHLQGTHDLYTEDAMKLPYWIIVFGATYFVFAMSVPHLHGLRWWSTISCGLVIVFMIIIFGISIHDGEHMSESPFVFIVIAFDTSVCTSARSWLIMFGVFGISRP